MIFNISLMQKKFTVFIKNKGLIKNVPFRKKSLFWPNFFYYLR